jgi:hypothetical protein
VERDIFVVEALRNSECMNISNGRLSGLEDMGNVPVKLQLVL